MQAKYLQYLVNHVFMPPKLPQKDDTSDENDEALCRIVLDCALEYVQHVSEAQRPLWGNIIWMLVSLVELYAPNGFNTETVKGRLLSMLHGDIFVALIRAQNAGIVFRKLRHDIIFECFEVTPPNSKVLGAPGRLLCSFPGPAVSFPRNVFETESFLAELASFLTQMNVDVFDDAAAHARKAGIEVNETRDTPDPKYITQLLTGILHGIGSQGFPDVPRICKRIADDVLWRAAYLPWRRSPLWLVIRVALQTTLMREDPSHHSYKSFIAFVHCEILRRAVDVPQEFDSDLLFCMRAKVCRRAGKLGETIASSWLWEAIQEATARTTELMESRWKIIQDAHAETSRWDPDSLNPWRDTRLKLTNSKSYISRALAENRPQGTTEDFHPPDFPRLHRFLDLQRYTSGALRGIFDKDPYTILADFENSVYRNLASWTGSRLKVQHEESAKELLRCMEQYYGEAHKLYKSNPEDMSIMFLTLIELWIALDRIATAHLPLLKDYSPEVTSKLLEPLLLRKAQDLDRLPVIHEYLKSRHCAAAVRPLSSVFSDPSSTSFAVRHFDTSPSLQDLKRRIEADANTQRSAKRKELTSLNQQHHNLSQECNRLEHHHIGGRKGKIKKAGCQKCQLSRKMKKLHIAVHEWPLPSSDIVAKAVVFELYCPPVFLYWRQTTYFLLHDVCNNQPRSKHSPHQRLTSYKSLTRWNSRSSRITLASDAKPFTVSHYKKKKIPADEKSVCVPNGLVWRLFDLKYSSWTTGSCDKPDISSHCTFQLSASDNHYQNLQDSLKTTAKTPNEVISQQSKCFPSMTLHEYISFTHLRSGGRIQWLNILHAFVERSLSFNRESVQRLLLQAILQVGVMLPKCVLEWHLDLADEMFGHRLLDHMEALLSKVLDNWQEVTTIQTITLIMARLLGAEPSLDVVKKSLTMLRRIRSKVYEWMRVMQTKLDDSKTETSDALRSRLVAVAATCRSTYDIDETYLPRVLFDDDVKIYIECSIVIHDNDLKSDESLLHSRDRRLAHAMLPVLCARLSSAGFDAAIQSIWSDFSPSSAGWSRLPVPNDDWISCKTGVKPGHQYQTVHFNVLRGTLLIDGKPLSRLPATITEHSLYQQFFGNKVLNVVPSNRDGMEFATSIPIFGYQMLFSLRPGNILVIRAESSGSYYELLPRTIFYGDLPTPFIDEYVHWLDLASHRIEFRPADTLWALDQKGWNIDVSTHQMQSSMPEYLLDIKSKSFKMISARLSPLEHTQFVYVVYKHDCNELRAFLPRYKLSFVVKDGELESDNFDKMVVDSNNSSGTMIGLRNQLVLTQRYETRMRGLSPIRSVLIPVGKIEFNMRDGHVCVNIDTLSEDQRQHVRYHKYIINTELQRLDGSSSLESTLYKLYLHALTSFCLPDPLIQQTGTEEALMLLYSPACVSFQQLEDTEIDLFEIIADLTPKREFYPPHLRSMQTVYWRDLWVLSQSEGFERGVRRIFHYAQQLAVFRNPPPDYSIRLQPHSPLHLLTRGGGQYTSLNRAADYKLQPSRDSVCESRGFDSAEEVVVQGVVRMMFHRLQSTDPRSITKIPPQHIVSTFQHWEVIAGPHKDFSLNYRRDFVENKPHTFLLPLLDGIHRHRQDQFQYLFSIAAFSCQKTYRHLLPYLLAVAIHANFGRLSVPKRSSFDLSLGKEPSREQLQDRVTRGRRDFMHTPSCSLPKLSQENDTNAHARRRNHYDTQSLRSRDGIVDRLMQQWPCSTLTIPPNTPYHDLGAVPSGISSLFSACYWNRELYQYLGDLQSTFNVLCAQSATEQLPIVKASFRTCFDKYPAGRGAFSLTQLATIHPPPVLDIQDRPFPGSNSTKSAQSTAYSSPRLISLLKGEELTVHPLKRHYLSLLRVSQEALLKQPPQSRSQITEELFDALVEYHDACKHDSETILHRICCALSPTTLADIATSMSGQWPRCTWGSIMAMLSHQQRVSISAKWLHTLVIAGCSFIRYQQARRLLQLYMEGPTRHSELSRELQNNSLDQCSFLRNPDWLLVQIDNDFIARPVQLQIAQEMVEPSSGNNSLLQLNMGEGKSSVIIPLAAASLANGHQLVRVVVLKSLATQMFQLLVQRLTRLTDRRIFYLPFSRQVKITSQNIRTIHELYRACRDEGGILITQPEHMLSFTLMTMDMVLSSSSDNSLPNTVLASEEFVKTNSRDLVDESDEIFHPRYALIYTLGEQQPLQGHPYRWRIIMRLFTLAAYHAFSLKNEFPEHVILEDRGKGAFPRLSILLDDRLIGKILVARIADDVMDGKLSEVHFRALSFAVRRKLKEFISVKDVLPEGARSLRQEFEEDGTWHNVLILRGMLACGVLVYSLKKRRWRVDFGLDLQRSLLAVPYRAKDVPSLRSEFGHPDIAIALTCLSYYYEGLTLADVTACLNTLFQQDNPALEYESWIHGVDIPSAIQDVNGINMEDSDQIRRIVWPTFRLNQHVINFYMDHFVFPKAAKDFPHKLPTSGWDLAEKKDHPTTGFSGTNDNRYLIPTSIHQIDRNEQLGTNALVLDYLLRPENKYDICPNDSHLSDSLLRTIVKQDPEVRAFLDVGAQMLELRNGELARRWLQLRPEPEIRAAVYFNENDELTVVSREGIIERLSSSPFEKRLDQCLVYLDDAHTRGTDLKLPLNTRAAVTLGSKVTKDRLVQGCMRLRQLGHGQSVLFLAPPDIDRRIRELADKGVNDHVDVEDVLLWAMTETWEDIEHHAPLWAQQGFDHRRRKEAVDSLAVNNHGGKNTATWISRLRGSWVQPEARSLEDLYLHASYSFSNDDVLAITEFKERLDIIGTSHVVGLNMDEEQEREVSHEVEVERQQERPHPAKPAGHYLHPHLPTLVNNGTFVPTSPAFMPLFQVLQTTPHYSPNFRWAENLFASKDFAVTISPATANQSDYLKPVRWILSILSQGGPPTLIVLSPYEVNELLPKIRCSTKVNLHLYCPRVTKGMLDFESLNLHTIHPSPVPIPRSLSLIQLHLFAGQLYLPDEDVYAQLCDFLGLSRVVDSDFVQADGFVKPGDRCNEPGIQKVCTFEKSPVPFLKELIGLRRKGNSYMQTHMGQILVGRIVTAEQFS